MIRAAAIAALAAGLASIPLPATADKPAGALDPEIARWNASVVSQIRVKKKRHVVITAAAAASLRAAGMRVLKLARVVPAVEAGKPAGFKVVAIRPGTIPAALGLKSGDTVDEINKMPVRDFGEVMSAYKKLATAKRLDIRVRRGGKSVYLRIDIK